MSSAKVILEELKILKASFIQNTLQVDAVAKLYRDSKQNHFLTFQDSVHQLKKNAFPEVKHKGEVCSKKDELQNEITRLKMDLRDCEQREANFREAVTTEETLKQGLEDNVAKLRQDREIEEGKFLKVWRSYLTVIAWYKKFLGIHIKLDEDLNLVIVSFGYGIKEFEPRHPHVTFQVLNQNHWKAINLEPHVKDWDTDLHELSDTRKICWFLCRLRQALVHSKLLRRHT